MSQNDFQKIFSKNLKTYMELNNINNVELSKKLNVSESTVGKWLLQKSIPRMGIIEKLSIIFNIEKSDLIEDKRNHSSKSVGVKIPILGRVVAGIPIEAITDIEGYEEITADMASRGDFFALRIQGHSMEPRIEDGEIVICQRQSDVESGDIAIILINGDEATCKQIRKSPEGISLIGFNPVVYPPHFYSNKEIEKLPVTIIGRVVESRKTW